MWGRQRIVPLRRNQSRRDPVAALPLKLSDPLVAGRDLADEFLTLATVPRSHLAQLFAQVLDLAILLID